METEITAGYIGFAILGGLFLFVMGYVLRKYTAKMKVKRAEDKAKTIINTSKVEAERRRREADLEAKDFLLKSRAEFEDESKERRKSALLADSGRVCSKLRLTPRR